MVYVVGAVLYAAVGDIADSFASGVVVGAVGVVHYGVSVLLGVDSFG